MAKSFLDYAALKKLLEKFRDNFVSPFAEKFNYGETPVSISNAVPHISFVSGTRQRVGDKSRNVSDSFTIPYLTRSVVFWEVNLENIVESSFILFKVFDIAGTTEEQIFTTSVFVSEGNSSLTFTTPITRTSTANGTYILRSGINTGLGSSATITVKGTIITSSSLV